MVTVPKTQYPTYQDVMSAPEDVRAEIYGGKLHLQPRPAGEHNNAGYRLAGELYKPYELGRNGPGGWVFFMDFDDENFSREIDRYLD